MNFIKKDNLPLKYYVSEAVVQTSETTNKQIFDGIIRKKPSVVDLKEKEYEKTFPNEVTNLMMDSLNNHSSFLFK